MSKGKGPMDPFKGFGKGGYPAPKEAKGLVRSIVSSQAQGSGPRGFQGSKRKCLGVLLAQFRA